MGGGEGLEVEWQIGAVNRQKRTHNQRESGSADGDVVAVTNVVLKERFSE